MEPDRGGPQGTLLAQNEYIVATDNCAAEIQDEDKFKYFDDLSVTELICLSDILSQYDISDHVPSDIGTEQL